MTASLINVNMEPAKMEWITTHVYANQDIQEKSATQVRKLANLHTKETISNLIIIHKKLLYMTYIALSTERKHFRLTDGHFLI